MARIKYKYNQELLSFDKVNIGWRNGLKRVMLFMFVSIMLGIIYFVVLSSFFTTPKQLRLSQELDRMIFNYRILSQQVDQMTKTLNGMEQRDDNIYRTVYELNPVPQSIRRAGFGGVNRYDVFNGYEHSELMIQVNQKIDKLTKQMYIQSKSYDELIESARNQEQMLASRPAIQPIDNKDLTRTASGFGWRIHPIYKDLRFHNGMDFTAPTGTDIYVTGDGTVTQVGYSGGFGNRIIVEHGFGYKTIYAHLSKFAVRPGDVVKRGQVIGFVGNTGDSTAPHLHYEVHKNGTVVNPMYYYNDDLSPEEFALMVELSNAGEVYESKR
ncbi:MAG: M23 family metallopeptidase [Bacteroidales bacterium]|jgi:murein DD-endopeptidase MepM/ murein hydrolase activator NlpD|nr:M23 family metallopeptidase [Bacteroidales bacterium]